MRKATNGAAGDRLRESERQWQLWRLRGRQPGWIPRELWLLAAEAAAEQELESTARKLRLNSERLEPWLAEWERTHRSAESAGTEFVELPPLPYYEGPSSFIGKVSDQRERTHASRAIARIRLATQPPCGRRPKNAGSRSKNPPDANSAARGTARRWARWQPCSRWCATRRGLFEKTRSTD